MKRIGILGGTFNPIHLGHLQMAQQVLEKLKLDKVIFIPTYIPVHKKEVELLDARVRLNLVSLAIDGHSKFEVSDCELKRKGKSYTIDTITRLEDEYPKKTKFFFIIGQDSYKTLKTWFQIDELIKKVTFVVVNRPGSKNKKRNIKSQFVEMPGLDISSSYIRNQIKKGFSVEYVLPQKVFKYIKRNKLFRKL